MSWLLVIVAGLLETAFALSLKASENFTRLVPSILFVVFSVSSFSLLSIALKSLPVGSAYAVWTGIGAAGTALVGMVALGEPVTPLRVLSIVAIVAGAVGLQVAGGH